MNPYSIFFTVHEDCPDQHFPGCPLRVNGICAWLSNTKQPDESGTTVSYCSKETHPGCPFLKNKNLVITPKLLRADQLPPKEQFPDPISDFYIVKSRVDNLTRAVRELQFEMQVRTGVPIRILI